MAAAVVVVGVGGVGVEDKALEKWKMLVREERDAYDSTSEPGRSGR
jgi:hypothetical protein